MYEVELDQSKRLLVISAVRRVTADEVKLAAQRVRDLLHDVAPRFRVLADFRWLHSMDSAAARYIAEIMDTLAEKGVVSVTRVMPDPHKGYWSEYPFTIPLWSGNPNRDVRDAG